MAKQMRVGEIRVVEKSAYILRGRKSRKAQYTGCIFESGNVACICKLKEKHIKKLGTCNDGCWNRASYFDKPTVEEMILAIQKMTQSTYIELAKICPVTIGKTVNFLKCWDAEDCVMHEVQDAKLNKAFELMFIKIYENKEKCK